MNEVEIHAIMACFLRGHIHRNALSMKLLPALGVCVLSSALVFAEGTHTVSGVVLDDRQGVVTGALVTAHFEIGETTTLCDEQGRFRLQVPDQAVTLIVSGTFIAANGRVVSPRDPADHILLRISYKIPPAHESLVITATGLEPSIDRRDDAVYSKTLFGRDDQLFDTLAAGINAGQHEGGGKSLEIRRFGFNLDHGGVNGGLKVLVDDVQQNQSTQGHGQGYLGALKALTPELVDDVDILNGPFSAEYGDFSGLGVVHIRLKESLPDQFTARMQGGSFGAYRGFVGYSPALENADTFLAYEGAHTHGPFENPLRYNRHNVTGNYTRRLNHQQSLGFKLNIGMNDFFSSGQLPLDLVENEKLNRFGFIDPFDGGRVRLGTFGTYYKKQFASGDIFKLDGFLARSLFDLYSNFTFFRVDPVHGDEIQQHDSRLQQGVNTQFLHPYKAFGQNALLIFGSNFHDNEINVGLLHTQDRVPLAVKTSAHAHVTNAAGYLQQSIELRKRLHFDAGLRFDDFRFDVQNRVDPALGGLQSASRLQPKANFSYTPFDRIPVTLHASYGRGISSQDARGVVERPDSPRVSTTDFYQLGTSHNLRRLSFSTDLFLIDRSNEQVYIPDDGSFELKGLSRSYGWEAKTSVQIARHASLNGTFTQVSNAFYRGTMPRIYLDSAPHSIANAGLTIANWKGFDSSLRYRHISGYRLDGLDASFRARGLDVVDLSASRKLRNGVDLNFAIDNLNNKRYWETQNYFESQPTPDPVSRAFRVHATPGYPLGFTVGLTFRWGEK